MRFFEYFCQFENILFFITLIVIASVYLVQKIREQSEMTRRVFREIWTSIFMH